MSRILGIDYGTTRIGLAVSDALNITAQPIGYIPNENPEQISKKLTEILQKWDIRTAIIGLPLNMNGTEGLLAPEIREFGKKIQADHNIPVEFVDERLTSREVDRLMIDNGVRRKKRKQKRDTLAAVLILQNYLISQTV